MSDNTKYKVTVVGGPLRYVDDAGAQHLLNGDCERMECNAGPLSAECIEKGHTRDTLAALLATRAALLDGIEAATRPGRKHDEPAKLRALAQQIREGK